ncbi:MAG TPA: hypothetical protein VFW13_08025, partial [Phenylobacterium sp.]|nr:hypothetical protein [Phenylobacterium sp.]
MTAFNSADRPVGRQVNSTLIPRIIDIAERVMIVGAFLVYVTANYDPANWLNFAIACTDIVTVWFILIRRPANSVSPDPQDWILALCGTL